MTSDYLLAFGSYDFYSLESIKEQIALSKPNLDLEDWVFYSADDYCILYTMKAPDEDSIDCLESLKEYAEEKNISWRNMYIADDVYSSSHEAEIDGSPDLTLLETFSVEFHIKADF